MRTNQLDGYKVKLKSCHHPAEMCRKVEYNCQRKFYVLQSLLPNMIYAFMSSSNLQSPLNNGTVQDGETGEIGLMKLADSFLDILTLDMMNRHIYIYTQQN